MKHNYLIENKIEAADLTGEIQKETEAQVEALEALCEALEALVRAHEAHDEITKMSETVTTEVTMEVPRKYHGSNYRKNRPHYL